MMCMQYSLLHVKFSPGKVYRFDVSNKVGIVKVAYEKTGFLREFWLKTTNLHMMLQLMRDELATSPNS